MSDYLKNFFNLSHGSNIVFSECYSERSFYRRQLPKLSEKDGQPHIIFTGTDVVKVFPQINELMRLGLHVHVYKDWTCNSLKDSSHNGYFHMFEKFNGQQLTLDGTFATFLTQFDACLVTYDFSNVSSFHRFYNTIPNRFSLALTAGIPIIMPEGYLKGCEELLSRHGIGFTYFGYEDLKNKLKNSDFMDLCRTNAAKKAKIFALEDNFNKIDDFLRNLSSLGG